MKHLVCVNDNFKCATGCGPAPKKGEIVKMLYPAYQKRFIVIDNPYRFGFDGVEQCFREDAFREIDSSFGQYCEDIYLSIAQFEEAMKEVSI